MNEKKTVWKTKGKMSKNRELKTVGNTALTSRVKFIIRIILRSIQDYGYYVVMEEIDDVDPLEDLEEDETTAADIFKLLTNAWINERNCPDLLKSRNDLVDCMMDQIKQMEENLKSLSPDDFLLVPHKMEVDRIRYVISSYLRTRLEKIETYTVFLLKRDRAIANECDRYMSKAEFDFAENYLRLLRGHFQNEAFRYMPSLLHEFGGMVDAEVKPDMKSVVVLKMLKPVEGVMIKGSPVNLSVNTCHLLPFKDVKTLIENGSAVCV